VSLPYFNEEMGAATYEDAKVHLAQPER
jgi:hypothetical protein